MMPFSQAIGGSDSEQKTMELTLRYSGVFHSINGSSRKDEKHRIRKDLSTQLEQFWKTDSRLDGTYSNWL